MQFSNLGGLVLSVGLCLNASFAGAYDTIHSLDDLHGIWTLFFR